MCTLTYAAGRKKKLLNSDRESETGTDAGIVETKKKKFQQSECIMTIS